VQELDSPLEAWFHVLTRIRYAHDAGYFRRGDVWRLAHETYRDRRGDCEDTSILLADWLAAEGHRARVVIGELDGEGHAWVLFHGGGHDYILETTGGRGNYRRTPPRSTVTTGYVPEAQFDRTGIWFRKSKGWTPDYQDPSDWSRGPWPPERLSNKNANKER
jgi:transglutaminase-like putative cysteine protease